MFCYFFYILFGYLSFFLYFCKKITTMHKQTRIFTDNNIIFRKYKNFLRFLKERNVYFNYSKNLMKSDCTYALDIPQEFINYSFSWCKTEEGHVFWLNIHNEWKKYCIENKI